MFDDGNDCSYSRYMWRETRRAQFNVDCWQVFFSPPEAPSNLITIHTISISFSSFSIPFCENMLRMWDCVGLLAVLAGLARTHSAAGQLHLNIVFN